VKKEHGVPKRLVHPPLQPKKTTRPRPPAGDHRGGERARYGGGAPARRDVHVREDWGGGVRRGSSGAREPGPSQGATGRGNHHGTAPPRGDGGGRGGRTRTTGTGGGIGAGEGNYRVRGRRG